MGALLAASASLRASTRAAGFRLSSRESSYGDSVFNNHARIGRKRCGRVDATACSGAAIPDSKDPSTCRRVYSSLRSPHRYIATEPVDFFEDGVGAQKLVKILDLDLARPCGFSRNIVQ